MGAACGREHDRQRHRDEERRSGGGGGGRGLAAGTLRRGRALRGTGLGPPRRRKPANRPRWKGKEELVVWQPEGEPIGTVVYVHGVYDNVETAWAGDYGKFNDAYHKPGTPLVDQFARSGVDAYFVVAEAE